MTELNDVVRQHWLNALFILLTAGGAVASWYYHLPTWCIVLCLVLLAVAVVALLGDLGLFGSSEPD